MKRLRIERRQMFGKVMAVTSALLVIAGCSDDSADNIALGSNSYIGAERCAGCHQGMYDEFMQSGHPYKLSRVLNGQRPSFPFSAVPNPPEGYTWSDIAWMIGGFGWKARFMDRNGQIILGPTVQYNLETQGWSAYSNDSSHTAPDGTPGPWDANIGRKDYTCGKCHTTGWDPDGGHQEGFSGIAGTFSEPGVQCEACHGEGSHHANSPFRTEMPIDRTAELCGNCHTRDAKRRVEVSKGFIRHHEQYDEMIAGGHAVLECGSCHEPHASVLYRRSVALIADCVDCHPTKSDGLLGHAGSVACESCHMPAAAKSAVAFGSGVNRRGDISSHIFSINPIAATAEEAMFYEEDGKTFARGAVTLDFACLSCHNGEDASLQTSLSWAAENARLVHSP